MYKGYRIQCCTQRSAIPCRQAFHPICAYLHGLKISVESSDLEEDSREGVFSRVAVKILCINHMEGSTEGVMNQIYYRRFGLNFEQTAKMGGFEKFQVEFRGSLGYS